MTPTQQALALALALDALRDLCAMNAWDVHEGLTRYAKGSATDKMWKRAHAAIASLEAAPAAPAELPTPGPIARHLRSLAKELNKEVQCVALGIHPPTALGVTATKLQTALADFLPEWEPLPPMACIKPTPEAADAFWAYWKDNGETHKHGYYESTWGAINAALAFGAAPAAPADADIADAIRLRWLAEDHADAEVRARVRSICESIPFRSISGVRIEIDANMGAAPAAVAEPADCCGSPRMCWKGQPCAQRDAATPPPTEPSAEVVMPRPFDNIMTLNADGMVEDVVVYTADQMRAYGDARAAAAILADRAARTPTAPTQTGATGAPKAGEKR